MANNKKYISLSRLSNFLDNLKNTFALLSHKHTTSDITDYKVDTELSPDSSNPVANRVLDDEFNAVSDALGALELAIDSHDHNDSYYTKLEIDAFELITVDDIDTICGGEIASAANLTF